MTIPLPAPHVGDQETQINLDALAGQFPLGPHQSHHQIYPQARAYKSTDFSHNSSGNWLAITLDSERWDYYPPSGSEQHSTSSNTSRLTCRVPGLYVIGGGIQWDTNTTGSRGASIKINATTYLQIQLAPAAAELHQQVTTLYRLSPGDYVELMAFQDSGGTRTVTAAGAYSPEFWFGWISP